MSLLKIDEQYMRLAIAEAKKAIGRTSPNPCVGAVIVKDDQIVATGYHKKAGTPHAEIHALHQAGKAAEGATMYVTLEPCSHTGKTPPCCNAVVESGIARVVIGMKDPNPLVDGGGKQYLLNHSIEVTSGVLEQDCRKINEPFIKYISTKRPLVIIKAGISLDGRLNYKQGKSGWITGEESLAMVHQLRDQYDAILIGRGTAEIDNPSLTTRLSDGSGKDPIRVVLDSRLSMPPSAKILNLSSNAATWIFHSTVGESKKIEALERRGAKIFRVGKDSYGQLNLVHVIEKLGEKGVTSVLVEGGGKVISSFLRTRVADKAVLFIAPIFAGSGGEGLTSGLLVDNRESAITLTSIHYRQIGNDMLVEGNIAYP